MLAALEYRNKQLGGGKVFHRFAFPSMMRIKDFQGLSIINDFIPNDELDLFYCLQNITLVEKDSAYNVVDGQQRLTTIRDFVFDKYIIKENYEKVNR